MLQRVCARRRARRWALAGILLGMTAAPAPAQFAAAVPELRVQLEPHRDSYRDQIATAAREALTVTTEWLGPHPSPAVTIAEAPYQRAQRGTTDHVLVRIPDWPAAPAMSIETATAFGVARSWWRDPIHDVTAGVLIDGIAMYLQGRVVERLYDYRYLRTAHSTDAVGYFGGAVQWALPMLRLSRWTAGLGRPEFLADTTRAAWPVLSERLPQQMSPLAVRSALAFGTLERLLGPTTLQGALHAVARVNTANITAATIAATIGDAAGQDLSWFFAQVSNPTVTFDYAVDGLSSEPAPASCPQPCFMTRVTVARRGPGLFTGTSRLPVAEFESGDAMALRVTFADGQQILTRWDGRAPSRTFDFQGPATAVAAHLDPERVLLLDTNYLDNSLVLAAPAVVPVGKWVASWLVWLQDAMLGYGFLT